MQLLVIINSPFPTNDLIRDGIIFNYQSLFDTIYNVHTLMDAAKSGNELAEIEIKRIISQPRAIPLAMEIVKELYKNTNKLVILDGAFLQGSEVNFILNALSSKYNNVIIHQNVDDGKFKVFSNKYPNKIYHIDKIYIDDIYKISLGRYGEFKSSNKTDSKLDSKTTIHDEFKSSNKTDSKLDSKTTIHDEFKSSNKTDSKITKLNYINSLLDKVEEELDSTFKEVINPLNLNLRQLMLYLKYEWNNDKELGTLSLIDVITLLGYKLIPLEEE